MNFFDNIHETQITRSFKQPRSGERVVPLHRRLFPVEFFRASPSQRTVARAAVREVLG